MLDNNQNDGYWKNNEDTIYEIDNANSNNTNFKSAIESSNYDNRWFYSNEKWDDGKKGYQEQGFSEDWNSE